MPITRAFNFALLTVNALLGFALKAQTVTPLVQFIGPNGAYPAPGSLIQGLNGNLYGAVASEGTVTGGTGKGTLFEITPAGALHTLYVFSGPDGATPYSTLIELTSGELLGTTEGGGTDNWGTIFEFSPSGGLTTLYNFDDGADGGFPSGSMVKLGNYVYGIASVGGSTACGDFQGCGTIFRLSLDDHTLDILHTFTGPDGANPSGGLILASDGNLYGVTSDYGPNTGGTIFRISPEGELTTLYGFSGYTGPTGPSSGTPLFQASDGNLYGVSLAGGEGLVFRLTLNGTFTPIYDFINDPAGILPEASLVEATDGNLYGSTTVGNTIFKISLDGTLQTIATMPTNTDYTPLSAVIQDTDGSFYGSASSIFYGDGEAPFGMIYKLSTGLAPFVVPEPPIGKAGSTVLLLGTSLTGATEVSFHGTPASFKVVSASLIECTVPSAATSGAITVTLPESSLTSRGKFRVE